MKKFFSLLIVSILLFSLCSCDSLEDALDALDAAKIKTFQVENLSIDLNENFYRMDRLAEQFDFCISSEDMVIFGSRVDFAENDLSGVSLWDYAEAFRNNMDQSTMSELTDLNGIPTMQYEAYDNDNEKQIVFIALYEASDCFWMLQFISEKDDFRENAPLIHQYAQSVKCN